MQRFVVKTLGFILIPMLVILLFIFVLDIFLNQNSQLKNYSFNNLLESKIYKLPVSDQKNIIIAGDSRAERQLIPEMFELTIGVNSINIAVASGDLAQTVPALANFHDSSIFIISASGFQINDSAIDPGYLSYKCFQQFTLFEKITLFHNDINGLINMYKGLLNSILFKFKDDEDKYYYDEKVIQEKGFLGIEDTLKIETATITSFLSSHPWYKKINSQGSRYRIFKESFNQLDNRNALVIIFQPPVSPIWKTKTENTAIGQFEREYSKMLALLSEKSDNIVYYDFYTQNIDLLSDNMYYDYHHLNRNGSEIFSKILAERILTEIQTRSHNKSGNRTPTN